MMDMTVIKISVLEKRTSYCAFTAVYYAFSIYKSIFHTELGLLTVISHFIIYMSGPFFVLMSVVFL